MECILFFPVSFSLLSPPKRLKVAFFLQTLFLHNIYSGEVRRRDIGGKIIVCLGFKSVQSHFLSAGQTLDMAKRGSQQVTSMKSNNNEKM